MDNTVLVDTMAHRIFRLVYVLLSRTYIDRYIMGYITGILLAATASEIIVGCYSEEVLLVYRPNSIHCENYQRHPVQLPDILKEGPFV